jgi:uncharacterized membrane protein|nr:hypothetical protein [Kofleriaceae bacterium]
MTKLFAVVLLACVAGCAGSPTAASCPTSDPPTYASFGADFMTTYCTGCHSAKATNRFGAPSDQNFDTEADVIAHLDDIDQEAASGPAATNTDMPDMSGPVHTAPTTADRVELGQFLACLKAGDPAAN